MNSSDKNKFIAESFDAMIHGQFTKFKEDNTKTIRKAVKKEDYKGYEEIITNAIKESFKAIEGWEKTAFDEFGGQTPQQYFMSINALDDFLDVMAEMIERDAAMFPVSLTDSIKKFSKSFEAEILTKLDMIVPDKAGKLTPMQKAEIKAADIIAPEKEVEPLSRLLFKLDKKNVDEQTVTYIMDGLKNAGEASIPCLIAMCEKSGHEGLIYGHSITALANIASEHKTEEIYRYLKECFRKSKTKIIEANALGIYGDGRAVVAIRSYVENDVPYMEDSEYQRYRNIILDLGGMVDDLDNAFETFHRR
ncbi:MAG: hypothetical protein QME45_00310 [Clostridiales bacterium]|nr:hypothetical protein [Clostridiales bacterium]